MKNLCRAAVLLDSPKMRTLRALTAHSLRTQKMVQCGQGAHGAPFHPCGLGNIWFMYFVFRFTRFEQMSGTKIDHLGVPVFNVSTVTYTH